MIIFGWNHKMVKDFGPTFRNQCNHCNNNEYWVLTRIMTWFTLFFIPVFPYEIKHFLTCPICQYGAELKKEQIDSIKPLAEANQQLIDGKISETEYKMRISALGSGDNITSTDVEATVIELTNSSNSEQDQRINFCSECGTKIDEKMKFCEKCGTKVD